MNYEVQLCYSYTIKLKIEGTRFVASWNKHMRLTERNMLGRFQQGLIWKSILSSNQMSPNQRDQKNTINTTNMETWRGINIAKGTKI